ncbi:MAG TPA: MATE family efflux transporter [Longimicrobiales bacterium]
MATRIANSTVRPAGRFSLARGPSRARRARLFGHEAERLLRTAGPIVVSQLGQVGMNTVDTLMVGPLGATPLAAAAFSGAVHNTTLWICSGVVMGMSPLVSQAFGAGDRLRCRQVLLQGLWLALALSVPLTWISLEGEAIARAMGQDDGVAVLAGGYLWAIAFGALPMLLFTAFRQFLEGMGLTRAPMVITLIGLALNAVANWGFIYGVDGWIPAMGVVGSGWATTIVRWAMLAATLAYLAWHPRLRPFHGVRWRLDPRLLDRIARIGTPIGAQLGLEVGLFAFAAVMMGWFGPVELAAHQVTINIASTTFMVALGVSIAGSIRVGQHIGAGRRRGVHRAVLGSYLLAVGFMGLCALLFLAMPEGLIGLYTDDPALIELGAALLAFAAAFQLFDGGQVAGIFVLRGAADTKIPTVIAAFGYWAVGLPIAYALGFHTTLGPSGIWIGLAAALAVVAVLMAFRVRRMLWLRPLRRVEVGAGA